MGCGGGGYRRGMYRALGQFIDEELEPAWESPTAPIRRRETRHGILQEVKLMYARGGIDRDTYHRLMETAQTGDLTWDDLRQMSNGSEPQAVKPDVRVTSQRDKSVVSSLNRLYRHRTRLEAARAQSAKVLDRLENDLQRLHEQADKAQKQAQEALPDEEAARAYLEIRQRALDYADKLQQRVATLRADLHRIDTLLDELTTHEAELKAVESGEQLAEIEASIREDLLDEN
jgi:DNA repair exonuclease SbcCD ATPase subunit